MIYTNMKMRPPQACEFHLRLPCGTKQRKQQLAVHVLELDENSITLFDKPTLSAHTPDVDASTEVAHSKRAGLPGNQLKVATAISSAGAEINVLAALSIGICLGAAQLNSRSLAQRLEISKTVTVHSLFPQRPRLSPADTIIIVAAAAWDCVLV